jgi:tRNA pseudouridine32 synthase/23S rRNA pseudouridine746 synthase
MILVPDHNLDHWQAVTYWYEGICPYQGKLLRLPRTRQAEAIAEDLMQDLSQESPVEGKMYGILLAKSVTGEPIVIKAFSGLLNGKSQIDGWVPPIDGRSKVAIAESITLHELAIIKQELITLSQIPERLEYAAKCLEYDAQLQILRDRHQISKQERTKQRELPNSDLRSLDRESQLEKMARRDYKRDRDLALRPLKKAIAAADLRMQTLKTQRRERSRHLQAQMHSAYVLTNFAGEKRSLKELIMEGAMPTGMGDCCAPKLLDYAANHRLTPIAMAEFWWGNPSLDGYKVGGQFYGACTERCQPLMGFLLSGIQSAYSPFTDFVDREESLSIIYEDNYLIAIAKPTGLLSVPGRYLDTQDSVLSRLRSIFANSEIYPVHRLDRQTSGILLFARDLDSLRSLSSQFQQRQIYKVYEALLSSIINHEINHETNHRGGLIDLPLWGNPENRPYQQVNYDHGKPSVTKFRWLSDQANYSRLEFMPKTGRTHQLRVHSADPRGLGTTILDDRLYGCKAVTDRLHLHARELKFVHPRSQELIHLQVTVPF